MKRNMFIAAILLIWNSGIGQQKTKTAITYQVDIAVIIDTAKVAQNARGHRQYGVIRKNVISILKDTKPQFFTLLIADNEAMFYKNAELGNDNDQQINLTKILTDNRNFYQNRLTNESLEHITTLGNDFIVTHNPVDWTITSESKQIGQYLTFKATATKALTTIDGNRKIVPIVAWFAPSLPFGFGPKEYQGLPGLILELNEGIFNFYVIELKLNKKIAKKVKRPTRGAIVSFEKFNELTKSLAIAYRKAFNN